MVDPATFATSTPGIHAVGDAITYPGKRKLILSGFHEGARRLWRGRVAGGHKLPLEYTTSSERLQGLLGWGETGKLRTRLCLCGGSGSMAGDGPGPAKETVGWRPESVGGACYSTNYRPGSYLPGAQITQVRSYSFQRTLVDLIDFLYLRA